MLCQFSFKNYKSYKDETTIEMQAENINEFKDTLIKSKKDSKEYLPVISIYGPNSGGKSNALEALVALMGIILAPIKQVKQEKFYINVPVMPYKFSNKKESTDFEVYYRIDKEEFRFNISVLNNNIIYESLYVLTENAKKPSKIFVRNNNIIDLGDELSKQKVSKNCNPNLSYLSFLKITHDCEIITKAVSFFENTTALDCGQNLFSLNLSNIIVLEENNFKDKFLKLLNSLDTEIKDYRIEKISEDKYTVFTKHIINENEYEINLGEESQGTQKIFMLLPAIIISILDGKLTIIDEMDAKLHPKIIGYIIEMFKDKEINKKNAQLLITSHDLTTMNKDVFRRDEILFASKNENEQSGLYSLYEIRDENGEHIRPNAAFNKQYIEGRYGADPYLERILNWEE